MKASVPKLLLCVVLLVLASGFVGGAYYLYTIVMMPTLERFGGTVLAYEVDAAALQNNVKPPPYRPDDLADTIRRRISPNRRNGITVRMLDPIHVEIVVPHVGDYAGQIQRIKELAAQQGRLEFRIAANRNRDGVAFRSVDDDFKSQDKDGKRKSDLRRAAEAGLPLPDPVVINADEDFTYSWIEMGPTERATLGLNSSSRGNQRWQDVAKAREKAEAFVIEFPAGGGPAEAIKGTTSMMIWSRKCENARLDVRERAEKEVEYFILVRKPVSPEFAVTGRYLIDAQVSDTSITPAVEFQLNAAGAKLFGKLTADNLPVGKEPLLHYSAICIMIDDCIVTAPTLNSAIHDRGVITGLDTPNEAERLATILRAGELPVPLKPLPIRETVLDKK